LDRSWQALNLFGGLGLEGRALRAFASPLGSDRPVGRPLPVPVGRGPHRLRWTTSSSVHKATSMFSWWSTRSSQPPTTLQTIWADLSGGAKDDGQANLEFSATVAPGLFGPRTRRGLGPPAWLEGGPL